MVRGEEADMVTVGRAGGSRLTSKIAGRAAAQALPNISYAAVLRDGTPKAATQGRHGRQITSNPQNLFVDPRADRDFVTIFGL